RTEIDAKVATPSTAEIEEVYRLNPQRAGGKPLDEVRASITEALIARRRRERELRLLSELATRFGYDVEWKPPRIAIEIPPGAPPRGAPDAPVTIVEFADFECPHCRELAPTLARLVAEHPRDVRICFRDFPLPNHPRARAAAAAARAAGEQGRYGE